MATKSASFIDFFAKDYRRAIVVGVLVIAAIILLFVFKDKIKEIIEEYRLKRDKKQEEIDWYKETGEWPTLSSSQIKNLVVRLKTAGPDKWGTDEDEIYAVFNEIGNGADLKKLNTEYGSYNGKDLRAMIRDELTSREIRRVNEILQGKNIAYQF